MMIPERSAGRTGNMNLRRAILPVAGFFLAGALNGGVAAQSVAPIPPPAPAAMPASAAAPIAVPPATPAKQAASQDNSTAPKAPKKHKVFTDDDVSALRAKSHLANDEDGGAATIYGATGACDADCEAEVKEKLGITPEQEGEWKLQLTAARREIGEDHAWATLYAKGQQTMRNVCTLRTQIANAAVPSGNDYQSQLERAKQQKMFDDEAAAMGQQMENSIAAMNQHITPFSASEPVRATMMAAIGERLFSDCPDSGGN
jgi:hypothetical protein